jgi:V/A-type H+-transporting ATPase subunit D
MEQVSPTRMNMLTKKAQIGLAKQGVDLLKKKRDALVKEFFSIVNQLLNSREKLNKIALEAYQALIIAKAIDGEYAINSVAMATQRKIYIEMEEKSVWGVKVPEVKKINVCRSVLDRGYGILGVSSRIDETAELFEQLLNILLEIAYVEVHLKRLGAEIKKTTRRVNALEQNLIPNLNVQVRYIKNTLEERAREDTFRLKRIKKASQ